MKKITLILAILFAVGLTGIKYVSAQNATIPSTAVSFPNSVIDKDGGTIDFYAKLTGFAGPVLCCTPSLPYFFIQRDNVGSQSTWFMGFNNNDGLGNGGLTSSGGKATGSYTDYDCGTGPFTTPFTYENVLGTSDQWHHYRIVWDKNGAAPFNDPARRMDIYIDDVLNSQHHTFPTLNGDVPNAVDGTLNLISTGGFSGGTLDGMIAIDEFKVYDRNGNLVLYNSLGSETEVRNSITGPNGSFNGVGNAHFIQGIVGNAIEANPVSGFGIAPSPDSWTQKADFGGTGVLGATGFSIGNKGYMGTGYNGSYYKDFWEYDPAANTWTQKADFAGGPCNAAVSFTIGNKGYVGTGYTSSSGSTKGFWEYDATLNTWTKKADFGGVARFKAVGFSIGTKGYIGTGINGGCCPFNLLKDFWEYDSATDTWTQKEDFGGGVRGHAVGFAIGVKGYVGTGQEDPVTGVNAKDFWEFDPVANTWVQKADFGGGARGIATGFSIGNKGYLGTGGETDGTLLKDFWEFDPNSNTWTQKADFGGAKRVWATGFSIGDKGYLGTGQTEQSFGTKDFWEYTPGTTTTSCAVPTGLTTVNTTSTTAKLKWDAFGGAEGYMVRYRVVGSDVATMKSTTTSSKKLSGLTPATSYAWQVKTMCSTAPPALSSGWSAQQFFTTSPLKLADEQLTTLSVYPNPTSGQFKIAITLGDEETSSAVIQVINSLGQIMYNEKTSIASGMLLQEINLKDLPAGMYLVKVIVNDLVYSAPINFQK